MAKVGRKRKATCTLEDATKRMRIEIASTTENEFISDEDNEEYSSSHHGNANDSEDDEFPTADTPITPFSPSRKFPSELKTIKCTYEWCTKTFNRPARLRSHLRSHTNERPFACDYSGCDKTYIEEKHLKQHIKGSHTHEKSYQCDWDGCSKSFLTATRLRRHREAHEGHERFRCTAYPPCNQTFRKHQTLQRHIRSDHLELAPFPCTYINLDTNAVCEAGFDTGGALRKHEDRVHGALRFWCDDCSPSEDRDDESLRRVAFRTKNELVKHIRTEHSNCIFCDLKCSNLVELQKHVETQHCTSSAADLKENLAERKNIPCTFLGCYKTFTKKYNLTVHIRSAHNGERFHCSSSIALASTFKDRDLAFWTGEDACGKYFVTKVNLEDHVRTQHLGLPSIANAKKIKGPKSAKDRGKKSSNKDAEDLDAINRLTGAGYGQDSLRNIPCAITDCPWVFTRQYDLDQHLRSKHSLSQSDLENATEAALLVASGIHDNDRSTLERMYDQADWEWQMQTTAANTDADAPFWIGAPDDADNRAGDSWSQEEREMRRLIDQDMGFASRVDPALQDL